jgi:hypothetical protein
MAGETLGGGDYDPTKLAGRMRLTEAEIMVAAKFSGDPSSYDVDYTELAEGQEVTFHTEESEYEVSRLFRVTVDNLVAGVTHLEGKEAVTPPVKLFEATVLETDRDRIESGEDIFGLIFPEGFAVLVDSAPEGDYTDRRIRASLVLAEAGEL